jgi:ParB/RepB/Spo0J family partition protein
MPATKIETGVLIELNRLELTANARRHRPEKIASLARSLKDLDQQLEDIIICPKDEAAGQASALFDVLAGGGRKAAEESLGWEKARCTIMYGLSPYEKLRVTLDENEEREATGPLDDARIYSAMLKAGEGLTQEKLAEKVGMTQERLNQYLGLTKLDPQVQDFITRVINLTMAHLLQICRLKSPESQIEMAKKAEKEGWTVKELTKEVNKSLGMVPSPNPLPKGRGPKAVGLPPLGEGGQGPDEGPDPLASTWSAAHNDEFIRRCGEWAAAYGQRHQLVLPPSELAPSTTGWLFWIEELSETPKQMLAQWFGVMAERLGYDPAKKESADPAMIPDTSGLQWKAEKAIKRAKEIDQESLKIAEILARLWEPKTPEEAKAMAADDINPLLPNAPEEWAAVEQCTRHGAAFFLENILGFDTYWSRKCEKVTWDDLGIQDPIAGCHKIIEVLRAGVA